MKTSQLQKILRSTPPPAKAPVELRDRLVAAIPEQLAPGAEPQARWIRPRWAYGAVAACLLVAALHLGGLLPWQASQVSAPFSLVPAAFASVVENLKNTGALVLELEVRTRGPENFDYIDPELPFTPIKIWIERPSPRFAKGRMRLEKSERRVVFDGQSTLFYFNFAEFGQAEAQTYLGGRIDRQLADPARWLEECGTDPGTTVQVDTVQGGDGRIAVRLSVREKGMEVALGSPRAFYPVFDRRTVVSWDAESKLLTDLEKYVQHQGQEVLVARLRSIEYKEQLEDSVFSHELPPGTHLRAVADPTNQRYSELGPVEVARLFFEAWQEEDWGTIRLFCESEIIITYMRQNKLKSFKITGEPYKWIPLYPGYQVPYELVFENGQIKRHALALRNDNEMKRYIWDGGL